MKTTPKQSKPRSDAWDADLSDAQRWQAYDLFRRSAWYEVAEWVRSEFALTRAPGRNALYRWARRMREDESAHRVEQAITARDEIGALANTAAADAALIDAYKSLAADLALKGNASDAVKYTVMAMEIGNAQRKAAELDLKRRAQETKDEQLKLAREKFEAAEARIAATRKTLERLNQSGGLTLEARAEIEKAMGIL
jgi:hypothetical protein